jgi:hypothetical protein
MDREQRTAGTTAIPAMIESPPGNLPFEEPPPPPGNNKPEQDEDDDEEE